MRVILEYNSDLHIRIYNLKYNLIGLCVIDVSSNGLFAHRLDNSFGENAEKNIISKRNSTKGRKLYSNLNNAYLQVGNGSGCKTAKLALKDSPDTILSIHMYIHSPFKKFFH